MGSLQIQYHLQHHLLKPHRSSRCLTLISLEQPVFSENSVCYVTAAETIVQVTMARLYLPSPFSSHILACLLLFYCTSRCRLHVLPLLTLSVLVYIIGYDRGEGESKQVLGTLARPYQQQQQHPSHPNLHSSPLLSRPFVTTNSHDHFVTSNSPLCTI